MEVQMTHFVLWAKALISTAVVFAATTAHANGLCPYDEQGPLGCPDGTVWHTDYEVCVTPDMLVG
jgi:hypothetical protein